MESHFTPFPLLLMLVSCLIVSLCRSVAVFRVRIQIYKHHKEERIARTWGTTAPGLPYSEEAITNAVNWLIGGDLEVIEPVKYSDGLHSFCLSPAKLREEFVKRDADAIFAFQLRNLMHNGHALLMTGTRKHLLEYMQVFWSCFVFRYSNKQEIDAKGGAELLDLIVSKGVYGDDQSSVQIASSPPFFGG